MALSWQAGRSLGGFPGSAQTVVIFGPAAHQTAWVSAAEANRPASAGARFTPGDRCLRWGGRQWCLRRLSRERGRRRGLSGCRCRWHGGRCGRCFRLFRPRPPTRSAARTFTRRRKSGLCGRLSGGQGARRRFRGAHAGLVARVATSHAACARAGETNAAAMRGLICTLGGGHRCILRLCRRRHGQSPSHQQHADQRDGASAYPRRSCHSISPTLHSRAAIALSPSPVYRDMRPSRILQRAEVQNWAWATISSGPFTIPTCPYSMPPREGI